MSEYGFDSSAARLKKACHLIRIALHARCCSTNWQKAAASFLRDEQYDVSKFAHLLEEETR